MTPRNPNAKQYHHMSRSPTYRCWDSMKTRCNPKTKNEADQRYYVAAGIKVCERWNDFRMFLADMGERPSKQHSIDRIDPAGDYEPGNCRWATQTEQIRSRRNTIMVELNGEALPLATAIEKYKPPLSYAGITKRLRSGISVADAFNIPPHPRHKFRGPKYGLR